MTGPRPPRSSDNAHLRQNRADTASGMSRNYGPSSYDESSVSSISSVSSSSSSLSAVDSRSHMRRSSLDKANHCSRTSGSNFAACQKNRQRSGRHRPRTRTLSTSPPTSSGSLSASSSRSPSRGSARRGESREALQGSKYKTELCNAWSETGTCRYGDRCQFAHGTAELRPVVRHPKYKTQECKSFWTTGMCPYGTRCKFIHSEKSLPPQPDVLRSVPLALRTTKGELLAEIVNPDLPPSPALVKQAALPSPPIFYTSPILDEDADAILARYGPAPSLPWLSAASDNCGSPTASGGHTSTCGSSA